MSNIFSVHSDTQDIEILLDNVSETLQQWEGGETVPLDLSIMLGDAGSLSQRAGRLKNQWNINSWAIIQSTRPGLGPWVIRFQHIVRKLTWWYLEPIIQQIRAFQQNNAFIVDGMAQGHEDFLRTVQQQAAQIEALERKIAELEKTNN